MARYLNSIEAHPQRKTDMGWKKSLNSLMYESIWEPEKLHLGEMRLLLHDALRQCEEPMCQRMRWHIDAAGMGAEPDCRKSVE